MEKRPALGKGLSALIPDAPEPARSSPVELDVDRLTPNTYQPRGQFDDARLDDLARSIKSNGVIQKYQENKKMSKEIEEEVKKKKQNK